MFRAFEGVVAHEFRSVDREQQFLLPPDVRDWLPPEHLAWLVIETVGELDLAELEAEYRLGGAGRQAYAPAMLTALLLYGYAVGERSSRRLERACETDVAFRVIAANQRPDHATIARFRARHQRALEGLFVQVLGLCVTAGLVDGRLVAVDSTKVAANASGSANLTREQLEAQARSVFDEAARVDADEDDRFGPDRRGDEPAAGWQPGAGRQARIRQALAELDAQPEGSDQIERRQQQRITVGRRRRGRPPLPADPTKPWRVASRQRKQRRANVTDPQSRLLKAPGRFLQGYSAQAVADRSQIILAADVTNDQNDNAALEPMLARTRDNLRRAGHHRPVAAVLADRGYWNSDAIGRIETDQHIVALIATVKDRDLRARSPGDPHQPALSRMHQRLQHPTARRLYRQRSVMIEPIFGQRKTNRRLDRFWRRGLDAVRAEWTLECIAHNLTKLWRVRNSAIITAI